MSTDPDTHAVIGFCGDLPIGAAAISTIWPTRTHAPSGSRYSVRPSRPRSLASLKLPLNLAYGSRLSLIALVILLGCNVDTSNQTDRVRRIVVGKDSEMPTASRTHSTMIAPAPPPTTESRASVAQYKLKSPYAKAAVEQLVKTCKLLRSFIFAFPNADIEVMYWYERNGVQRLTAEALAFGRYEVKMQIPFDKNNEKDAAVGTDEDPAIFVWERSKVTVDRLGVEVYVEYAWDNGLEPKYGADTWWRFVDRNQDWSVFGIKGVNKLPAPVVRDERRE